MNKICILCGALFPAFSMWIFVDHGFLLKICGLTPYCPACRKEYGLSFSKPIEKPLEELITVKGD